jgi:hypothetical protein
MAYFPFSGWKDSFFGDLHAQGRDAIDFYTEKKSSSNAGRRRGHESLRRAARPACREIASDHIGGDRAHRAVSSVRHLPRSPAIRVQRSARHFQRRPEQNSDPATMCSTRHLA